MKALWALNLRVQNSKIFNKLGKDSFVALAAFVVPLALRFIPEVIMNPYLVGFDTLAYYVPKTLLLLGGHIDLLTLLSSAPFFYMLLAGLISTGIPLTVSLKLLSPLLYGILGLTIFLYANKGLQWSRRKGFAATLFATLYFTALRISWDMLRSELALIFLFVTLVLLLNGKSGFWRYFLLSSAMFSVVLSHQVVSVIMFAIVLVMITKSVFDRKTVLARNMFVCSIPAGLLFFAIIYAISFTSGLTNPNVEEWASFFGYSSPTLTFLANFSFLVLCYLPLLPLLVRIEGYGKNLQLVAWILATLVAFFVNLLFPIESLRNFSYRWILLLTYPLAFLAADAFSRLKLRLHKIATCLLIGALGFSYLMLPTGFVSLYSFAYPNYVPASMLENTVPMSDCKDVVYTLEWVKDNLDDTSLLLVHDVFVGWAFLSLKPSQIVSYGYGDPSVSAHLLSRRMPNSRLLLIWWVNGTGMYGQYQTSSSFLEVFRSGRIAIFRYESNDSGNRSIQIITYE